VALTALFYTDILGFIPPSARCTWVHFSSCGSTLLPSAYTLPSRNPGNFTHCLCPLGHLSTLLLMELGLKCFMHPLEISNSQSDLGSGCGLDTGSSTFEDIVDPCAGLEGVTSYKAGG